MADHPFTDIVKITLKSGDGGDGMNSFSSQKGKPLCGPDGGDGGDGGNVYFEADPNMGDLLPFRFKKRYKAENGQRGGSGKCTGRRGEDLIIAVPQGTIVKDAETGAVIADMFEAGERKMAVEGGRGGKGNVRFATAKRHAPNFAQKGEPTEFHDVVLELKTIADIGFVGFPNAGKSTLLSKISGARPKIAGYRFTTLSPNLGVIQRDDRRFVAADIPGLIEGAAEGAGLGHDFLRHIERTRAILHIVDISGVEGRDPLDDFEKINFELASYSEKLAALPKIVALNKTDIYGADENVERFKKKYGKEYEIYPISAATGEGLAALLDAVFDLLSALPPASRMEEDENFSYRKDSNLTFEIVRDEQGYVVLGDLVDMLCRNVSLSDTGSMAYFENVLKDKGVFKKLEEMGAKEGDTVTIGEVEFEYVP